MQIWQKMLFSDSQIWISLAFLCFISYQTEYLLVLVKKRHCIGL